MGTVIIAFGYTMEDLETFTTFANDVILVKNSYQNNCD